MYKLMIVDDEEEVRKRIMEEIAWEDYGFIVVGEAENGKDAIELAEIVIPDVVVTDIKMPYMDGLQLSKHLKDIFPTVKILILTGFDEFEFAQQALKLHVDEYILKPVLSNELIEVLIKIKKQIDEETAQREDISALQDLFRRSLPILKEKFLASLLTKKMAHDELEEKSHNYEIDLQGHSFIVSVISIDNNISILEDVQNPEKIELSRTLKYSPDTELKLFAVFNIAEEIVIKYGMGIVFMNNNNIVVISKCPEVDEGNIVNKTLHMLEEIRMNIEKYLKFTVTIGKGTICYDITNISYSYNDAVLALDYKAILGNNRVICIEDFESNTEKIGFDELKEQALIRCIKVGTVSEIRDIIRDLFSDFEDSRISIKYYQIYLLELIITILKSTKGADIELDDVFGTNSTMLNEILKFNNIFEAKEWFTGLCIRIMDYISYDRQNSCHTIVERSKEFITNNYHQSGMTLNKMSDYLHISSGYFSSIFKKETKITFLNYLTQIRMEAAKELLRTTDFMAFEIADKVGFSEPYYFSYCFKKHLGITPKQYRNSSRVE